MWRVARAESAQWRPLLSPAVQLKHSTAAAFSPSLSLALFVCVCVRAAGSQKYRGSLSTELGLLHRLPSSPLSPTPSAAARPSPAEFISQLIVTVAGQVWQL